MAHGKNAILKGLKEKGHIIKVSQFSQNGKSKMKYVLIICQLEEFLKARFDLSCLQKYKN